MLQYIEDEWLVIVDCIEKGIIPDLEITQDVRVALEVSLSYCYIVFRSTLYRKT